VAPDRQRLEELSAVLRQATMLAFQRRSPLARSLDESRCELERLLMLAMCDPTEYRRAVIRAQLILDAWRSTSGAASDHREP
jgi:hypothetical protein